MRLKKNDLVFVIAGKDRGKTGKITHVFPKKNKIVVEGINIKKKHVRPKGEGQKGQIIQMPMPIDASNVKFVCPGCKKAVRLGYKLLENGKKIRVCKKCREEIY